jgi:hypothetical protein
MRWPTKKQALILAAIVLVILICIGFFMRDRRDYNNPSFRAYWTDYEYCEKFQHIPGTPKTPIKDIYDRWKTNQQIGC